MKFLVSVVLLFASVLQLQAISSLSQYTQLANDYFVTTNSQTGQVVLQTIISLADGHYVLVESDGRFYPSQQLGLATVEIRMDGGLISNGSALDFRSSAPEQHSFNCIGLVWVPAGTHTFQLVAYNHPGVPGGKFYVGNRSNLSVVVDPSTANTVLTRSTDSGNVNVTTLGFKSGVSTTIPNVNVLSGTHSVAAAPLVVLASGRSIDAVQGTAAGDAMWGVFLNGACPANSEALWTVSDLSNPLEWHAPMYSHAMFRTPPSSATFGLYATELPYEDQGVENPVQYVVGSTTKLIALSGGMPIYGSAAVKSSYVPCWPRMDVDARNSTNYYWTTAVNVQPGQNGNVMFLAKTRVLDCSTATGPGTATLVLELDGQTVGSSGVQQFPYNAACHQQTLAASYLALGLSAGTHTIRGRVENIGLTNLAISGDMGLLFFGN